MPNFSINLNNNFKSSLKSVLLKNKSINLKINAANMIEALPHPIPLLSPI